MRTFADRDLPVVDVKASDTHMTPERRKATLKELTDGLDAQRKSIFAYLEGLSDAELGRKARIPLFKDFKKQVERIPEAWVEEVRRGVDAGREFTQAVKEVFAANAQLLVWRRRQEGR